MFGGCPVLERPRGVESRKLCDSVRYIWSSGRSYPLQTAYQLLVWNIFRSRHFFRSARDERCALRKRGPSWFAIDKTKTLQYRVDVLGLRDLDD